MINKRGELTSRQLIIIIILIISFAIIIAFFFMLDLGGEIDRESCRNSVMMRKTFSILGIKFFSLKCKTQDVCFSMGGDCEEEVDEEIKVSSITKLGEELINLLADCWWMMGEGKVDYDSKGSCAICYDVYFDDEIKKQEKITLVNGQEINLNEPYFVITGIIEGDKTDKINFYPFFIELSSEKLKEAGCSKFITEV